MNPLDLNDFADLLQASGRTTLGNLVNEENPVTFVVSENGPAPFQMVEAKSLLPIEVVAAGTILPPPQTQVSATCGLDGEDDVSQRVFMFATYTNEGCLR